MKQYEARVYLGKDTYEKLVYLVETTKAFTSVNQLLGVLLKEQSFTDMLTSMVAIVKQAQEQLKEQADDK